MSQKPGKTYEMQWDCQFCGTKKLLGKTHRFCPNCGAPQNPDSRYFPADDEKVAVEDHVFVGADKICNACSELNSGNAEFCEQCGAPLTEAAQARLVTDQQLIDARAGEQFTSSGPRDVVKEKFDAEMERVGVTKRKNQGTNWKVFAIIGVIALVIVGIAVALLWKKEVTVLVTGHEWSREIRIEEYRNFTEQNWWDNRPLGDDVVRGVCVEKQRSTRQVPDGQECRTRRVDNGDGTYREVEECQTKYRSEPVYDDWCTWTGKRWEYERSVSTGALGLTPAPYWGEVSLRCSGQRSVGCERESGRNESYLVIFEGDEDREYKCPFPQNEWQTIPIESLWSVQVRVVDAGAADCDTLKRK